MRDAKRSAAWVITGRFGGEYALFHFRWPYLEVDLDDVRSANRLFEIIGRGGALQLRVPSTKSPIHYLVYPQAMIPLPKNALLNRNQTTWAYTDTRLAHRAFYDPTPNR